MFTITTYGTWLRGDARGWVDDGIVYPPSPALNSFDKEQLKDSPYFFDKGDRWRVGNAIGLALIARLELRVLALCVQSWHCHFVVGNAEHTVAAVIKCAKDAVRWDLRIDRRIWGTGYDKRYCMDGSSTRARIGYVERHNLRDGLAARPWEFISSEF